MNYPLVCLPLFPGHVCTQDMAQSSHGSAPVPREHRIKVMNTVTDITRLSISSGYCRISFRVRLNYKAMSLQLKLE